MRAQFHHGFLSNRRGSAMFCDHRCYRTLGWFECVGQDRSLCQHAQQSGNAPTSRDQRSCQSHENHRNRWPGTTPCPSGSCANWVGLAHYSSQKEWKLGQLGGYRSVRNLKRPGSDTTISESGGGAFVCGKETEDGTHPRSRRRIRVHTRRCWTHYHLVSQLRRDHARTTRRRGNSNERATIGLERESVIVQLCSPYADFDVFTPNARKTTRAHRFTAYLPQPDGSWLAKEIPGPANFQAWLSCWEGFRVACLMLKVAHEMPLDRYKRKIEKLATQWPTAWHLVCLAVDKCRFEHFNRFKVRESSSTFLSVETAPPVWDAASPWSAVFLKAVEDDETYWDDNIRHPAMSWLAWHTVAEALPKLASNWLRRRRWQEVWRRSSQKMSAPQGAVNSWGQVHFDQGYGTPDQEGEVCGTHSRREERSWASTRKEVKGQERRKGRKEQKSALYTRSRRCHSCVSVGISVVEHEASFIGL